MVIMMLSNVQKEGLICIDMPLLPNAFQLSPTVGAKSENSGDHSTAPRYTGAIPATCAWTG